MVWWESLRIALAGAAVGAIGSFLVTRANLRATQARDDARRQQERSVEVAAALQDKLLDFIAACEDASLDGVRYSTERAKWSRIVRNALPELEPNKRDSALRGLLNRSHEETLKAERYWHDFGPAAGKARLEEALSTCQYVVKSLSDDRSRKDVGPYTTRSVEDAEKSQLYWALKAGGGSTVPTNRQAVPGAPDDKRF